MYGVKQKNIQSLEEQQRSHHRSTIITNHHQRRIVFTECCKGTNYNVRSDSSSYVLLHIDCYNKHTYHGSLCIQQLMVYRVVICGSFIIIFKIKDLFNFFSFNLNEISIFSVTFCFSSFCYSSAFARSFCSHPVFV